MQLQPYTSTASNYAVTSRRLQEIIESSPIPYGELSSSILERSLVELERSVIGLESFLSN